VLGELIDNEYKPLIWKQVFSKKAQIITAWHG
jgi:hypothetical protein